MRHAGGTQPLVSTQTEPSTSCFGRSGGYGPKPYGKAMFPRRPEKQSSGRAGPVRHPRATASWQSRLSRVARGRSSAAWKPRRRGHPCAERQHADGTERQSREAASRPRQTNWPQWSPSPGRTSVPKPGPWAGAGRWPRPDRSAKHGDHPHGCRPEDPLRPIPKRAELHRRTHHIKPCQGPNAKRCTRQGAAGTSPATLLRSHSGSR